MSQFRVDPTDWASKARLRCPRGHTAWTPHRASWYCVSCEAAYRELVDGKTGERVPRDGVDLHRGGSRHGR